MLREVTDLKEFARLMKAEREWPPGMEIAVIEMVKDGLAKAMVDEKGNTSLAPVATDSEIAAWAGIPRHG